MENETRIARQNAINFILNFVIVILCIVTVICGCVAMHELVYEYSWTYDEDNFYYRIEDNDFYATVAMYHQNAAEGVKANNSMKEYYGVAKYFEAASLYRAFWETGDTARAEKQKVKMEEALPEMGGWHFLEDEIKEQLGLNQ